MSPSPSYLLAAACLLFAAGCAPAPAAPRDAPAPAPVATVIGAAAAPAGWAEGAHARCGALAFDARMACYDEVLLALLPRAGVRAAMETLDGIGARDAYVRQHGHVLAHHLGIAAYEGAERVGAVFAECTPSFQSGCYHGVIQARFADVPAGAAGTRIGAEDLNALCAAERREGGNRWLLFQCVHGIGHGLVALHDNHLPRALAGCDLLHDEWEREGCYGGAFMENIVHATMPHHAPRPGGDGGGHHGHGGDPHAHHAGGEQRPAGEHHAHGEHHQHHEHHAEGGEHRPAHGGGGDHAAHAAADAPFPPLDPADPHHPCSALDARYRVACYSMQTSAVLFRSGGEIEPAIRLCDEAPEEVRGVCFSSLGRDINAYSQQDAGRAAAECMRVPERFRTNCLIGVAKNRIDITADPADGAAFCRTLAAGAHRERCFQAVGEQVAVLEVASARRAVHCAPLAGADGRACRAGAGVAEEAAPRGSER